MSDIKVGDLVMVVRPQPCCRKNNSGGLIFTIKSIARYFAQCPACKMTFPNAEVGRIDGGWIFLSRLKKIDPPSRGDSLPTRKYMEITQ